MNNIFDLENINDLEEKVTSELRLSNTNKADQKILDLFAIKPHLNINEILVGLFRKFGIEKKRSWVANRLHALSKTGKLQKIKGRRGIYELKKIM